MPRKTFVRLLSVVLVVCATIAVGAAPASANVTLCGSYALFNRSANHYVSAEVSRPGWDYALLRARADRIGPWEEFDLCQEVNGGWGVITSLENYSPVSVNLSLPGQYDGAALADGSLFDGIQYREQFRIVSIGGGYYSLLSRTANKYLISETSYPGDHDGMLRAAADTNTSYRTHFAIVPR